MKAHPKGMLCVGCCKRSKTCVELNVGAVCRRCRPLLAQVIRWSGEAQSMTPPEQQPAAVRRTIYTRGIR